METLPGQLKKIILFDYIHGTGKANKFVLIKENEKRNISVMHRIERAVVKEPLMSLCWCPKNLSMLYPPSAVFLPPLITLTRRTICIRFRKYLKAYVTVQYIEMVSAIIPGLDCAGLLYC